MYGRNIDMIRSLRDEFAIAAKGDFEQVVGLSLQAGQSPGSRWIAYTERMARDTEAMVNLEHSVVRNGAAFDRYSYYHGDDVLPDAAFWRAERQINDDLSFAALQRSAHGVKTLLKYGPKDGLVSLEANQDELSTEFNMRRGRSIDQKPLFDADERAPVWKQPDQAEIYFHALRQQQEQDVTANAALLIDFARSSLGMAKFQHDDLLAKIQDRSSENALDWKQRIDLALGRGTKALAQADAIYRVHAPRLATFGRRFDEAKRLADRDPFAFDP